MKNLKAGGQDFGIGSVLVSVSVRVVSTNHIWTCFDQMQVISQCGEQKRRNKLCRNAIWEPTGYRLMMILLFIGLKLACKLATCETIRSYTLSLNLFYSLASQVANQTVNNEQRTEKEVLPQISAGYTRTSEIAPWPQRLIRRQTGSRWVQRLICSNIRDQAELMRLLTDR